MDDEYKLAWANIEGWITNAKPSLDARDRKRAKTLVGSPPPRVV